MQDHSTDPSSRIASLDFWRGIAVCMVLMHHFFFFHFLAVKDFVAAGANGVHTMVWRAGWMLIKFSELAGPLGVKIFFVVSGYIITRLMLEEEMRRGALDVYAFYVRRIFRIFPAYFVYLLGVALFGALSWILITPGQIGYAAAFLCNTGVACGWFVAHTWTLGIEMQFYLFWPLLFVFVPARHRTLFLIGSLAVLMTLSANGVLLARGWIDNALSFSCIALGALYAVSARVRAVIAEYGLLGIVVAVLAVGGLVRAGFYEPARTLYHLSVPLAILVVLFTVPRWNALTSSWIFWAFSRVGLVSYSLYLWQEVFAAEDGAYMLGSPVSYSVLLIAMCLLSYFFVELPGIRIGKKLLARRVVQSPHES